MPIATSPSEINAFRRCKRQYYYKSVEKIEPRLPAPRLNFGSWGHSLLQAHYSGGDWKKEHARQLRKFNNLFLEEREFYGDLPAQVERAMESYLFHWRREEQDWEILHVEQVFDYKTKGGDVLNFKPDLIVKVLSKKRIIVVDHKWVTSLPDAEWRMVDLQSTTYVDGVKKATGLD